MKKYGIVLIEKPLTEGLSRNDINGLLDMLDDTEDVFPIEILGNLCSIAIGFITLKASEILEFDIEELQEYIATIIDDMDNESPESSYKFKDIDIYMARSLPVVYKINI